MTRNIIVQVDIPTNVTENVMHGYWDDLYETSKHQFLKYARKVNADYHCIHLSIYNLHPTYERFQIFNDAFNNYDNILYVDCDIIPKKDSPNIFEQYNNCGFVAFPEGSVFHGTNEELKTVFNLTERMENILLRRKNKGYTEEERCYLSQNWMENHYFNGGIFLIDRESREKVRNIGLEGYLQPFALFDQSSLNKMVFENQLKFQHLSYKYNGLFHFFDNYMKSKIICSSYFVHFCGPMKNIFTELSQSFGNTWFEIQLIEDKVTELLNKSAVLI